MGDENEDAMEAVFVVQPEEMTAYKTMRRLVDKQFIGVDPFWQFYSIYFRLCPTSEGVNQHIRDMLFQPNSRGGNCSGHYNHDRRVDQKPGAEESRIDSMRQAQRKSKQKDRYENRLLSLLFAVMYDPATKDCRLAKEVPPLKLRRKDKKGNYRNVSNFTAVRLHLRKVVTSIIASYASSVRSFFEMAPEHANLLPTTFINIARTFLVTYQMGFKHQSWERCKPDDVGHRQQAEMVLNECIASIQKFLSAWEKRNFTTDNPLRHCLDAASANEIYLASWNLLRTMIALVPPTGYEPYDSPFRHRYIYGYRSLRDTECQKESIPECDICSLCSEHQGDSSTLHSVDNSPSCATACHAYVKAFTNCVATTRTPALGSVDKDSEDRTFSTSLWRYVLSKISLHRFAASSKVLQAKEQEITGNFVGSRAEFVAAMKWDVARLWTSLTRSNAEVINCLSKLGIRDSEKDKEKIVELVFGGSVAAKTLLENENDILPICAKLQTKKGQEDSTVPIEGNENRICRLCDEAKGRNPDAAHTLRLSATIGSSAGNSEVMTTCEDAASGLSHVILGTEDKRKKRRRTSSDRHGGGSSLKLHISARGVVPDIVGIISQLYFCTH